MGKKSSRLNLRIKVSCFSTQKLTSVTSFCWEISVTIVALLYADFLGYSDERHFSRKTSVVTFGQLFEKNGPLLISTSGHTEADPLSSKIIYTLLTL